MNNLSKIIRAICGLPVVGGLITLLLGVAPALLPAAILGSGPIAGFFGGALLAAWCYFLAKKQIINIVFPVIPIPLWTVGIAISCYAAFLIVSGSDYPNSETSTQYEFNESVIPVDSSEYVTEVIPSANTEPTKRKLSQSGLPANWPAPQSAPAGTPTMTAEQYEEAMRRSFEAAKALGVYVEDIDPKYLELPK